MENMNIIILAVDLIAFIFFFANFLKLRKQKDSKMYKLSRDYMVTTGIIAAILAYFAFVHNNL